MKAVVLAPFYTGSGVVAAVGDVVELNKAQYENLLHRKKVEPFVPPSTSEAAAPEPEEPVVAENRETDLKKKTNKRTAK